jgi:hypothetical protein
MEYSPGDMMIETTFSIENLIEIVKSGGRVKTGIDVYNKKGTLLLEKNVLVDRVRPLEIIRENGIRSVPVNSAADGGLWDDKGNLIRVGLDGQIEFVPVPLKKPNSSTKASTHRGTSDIEKRLLEIEGIK